MIRVTIPTYNRNKMLARLVAALERPGVDIHVYDDGSDLPVRLENATVHRYDQNAGLTYWYMRISDMMEDAARDESWDYMLWIPDDFYPKRLDVLEHLQSEFEALEAADPQTVCLNPFVMKHHPCMQWINFEPTTRHGHYQTQWMDCCGFVDRRFVAVARGAIRMCKPRYHYPGNDRGTGVGKMISACVHGIGYHMYQTQETLFSHDNHPSRLSPEKDVTPFVVT